MTSMYSELYPTEIPINQPPIYVAPSPMHRILIETDTVAKELKKQQDRKDTFVITGQWLFGGAVASTIAVGATAAILAATALLSNPVGWGILAGIATLTLISAAVGITLVATHSEEKVKAILEALKTGTLVGLELVLIVCVATVLFLAIRDESHHHCLCPWFIYPMIIPDIHIPVVKYTTTRSDLPQSYNQAWALLYNDKPDRIDSFIGEQASLGNALVGQSKIRDPNEAYKLAVGCVKKHQYEIASSILWSLYAYPGSSEDDKIKVIEEIAMLTLKTNKLQSGYSEKCRFVAYLLLPRIQQLQSDPMNVLNYALLEKAAEEGGVHSKTHESAKNLLELRYNIALSRSSENEKRFVELFEQQ